MSRFRHLEFEEPTGHPPLRTQTRLGDEERWLTEAQLAFEAGRFEPALRGFARALEFNPRSARAWAGQARMLVELGALDDAKTWADRGLQACPEDAELLAVKAVALGRLGDGVAALAFSDAAIAVRGDLPYVWLARADVLLGRKEPAAEQSLERALALGAFHWFQLWLASRVLAFHRRFARALQLAQRGLETAADRAVLWLQLGDCQLALGLAGAARHAFAQARELDPASVPGDRMDAAGSGGLGRWLSGLWKRWRER